MLEKAACYCLYLTVFFAFISDNAIFGPILGRGGALLSGLLPVSLFAVLVKREKLVKAFQQIFEDRLAVAITACGAGLLAWQFTANTLAGWTLSAAKVQLYWASGIGSVVALLAVGKTGLLKDLQVGYLLAAFCAGQTLNLIIALAALPELIRYSGVGQYYPGGAVGVLTCSISSLVCWCAAYSDFAKGSKYWRIGGIVLSLLSAFFIPTTGTRTGTLCFISLLLLWPFIFRKRLPLLFLSAAFVSGLLFMHSIHNTRALTIMNPSTSARGYLYLNDLAIISGSPLGGIGMDLPTYQERTRTGPYFAAFSVIDPWVAEYPAPHSWTLAIAIQSGIMALIIYLAFASGVIIFMFRASLSLRAGASDVKSFMFAYILVNIGLLFYPISDSFPWILLAAGFAIASSILSDAETASAHIYGSA
ncbi:MAG: hypothetical protein A2X31_07530 [Elusimicrobia bacterium GWB2_63_22]|nr:MAG: hypothetical protein A2X31_07530 [Elusimicrobia bacterium GWB2_63_22]